MSNLHPLFDNILKPHLQNQTIVARKRDQIRYNALHKGWQECGGLISFGTFLAAVDKYEATRDEAHLDAQFAYEQWRKAKDADDFEKSAPTPEQREEQQRLADEEAEREERRQYREWRNDSGV